MQRVSADAAGAAANRSFCKRLDRTGTDTAGRSARTVAATDAAGRIPSSYGALGGLTAVARRQRVVSA